MNTWFRTTGEVLEHNGAPIFMTNGFLEPEEVYWTGASVLPNYQTAKGRLTRDERP
jgi:hypothetical protein